MTDVTAHDARRWDDDPVPLGIVRVDLDGEPGLRVTGELDLAGCDRLLEEAAAAARPGLPLHIDLRGVTFLDSSGVRALLAAERRARGRGAAEVRLLAREGGRIARVLGMLGVGEALVLEVDGDR